MTECLLAASSLILYLSARTGHPEAPAVHQALLPSTFPPVFAFFCTADKTTFCFGGRSVGHLLVVLGLVRPRDFLFCVE